MSAALSMGAHSPIRDAESLPARPRIHWPTLGLVILAHICAGLALAPVSEVSRPLALRPTTISASILLDRPAVTLQATPAVLPEKPPPRFRPRPLPQPIAAADTVPAPASETPRDTPPEPTASETAVEAALSADLTSGPVLQSAVTPPRFDADYLDNPAPPYPRMSRLRGEYGVMLLRVYVDRRGDPAAIELKRSSGYERLDTAALDTVKHWWRARMGEAATITPQPELHILADGELAYKTVAQVMSDAARAGITRIGFVTDPRE